MNLGKIILRLAKQPLLIVCSLLLAASAYAQRNTVIKPGEVWPDNKGNHIQAHGGGIIKIGKTYYWYGEERAKGLDTNFRYVSCYESKDLTNWKFLGDVLKLSDPENLGRRYSIGSALTGWKPNPNKYATATSLSGPWTAFKDIAPPETNTYSSQSTMLIKVEGSKGTTVIYMGDQWKPGTQWDSRYLWMPVEIGDGKLWLPEPKPWSINIKTGEWKPAE